MLLLFVLLLVSLGWQSFDIGRKRGGYDHSRAVHERSQLRDTILQQRQEISALNLETARYHRASQIDSEAMRKSQTDMMSLLDERAKLKKEVGFLRGLISSQSGPVYVRDFKLVSTSVAGQYEYSFVVAQALDDFGVTKGKLQIALVGTVDGKQKEYPESKKKLEFFNYQEISGELSLPENFEPQYLQLEVLPSSKKLKKFSKHFAWSPASADGGHGDH